MGGSRRAVAMPAAVGLFAALVLVGAALVSGPIVSDGRDDSPSAGEPSGDGAPPSTSTSVRPPLDDPPDPGPVPATHGLSEARLADAVDSSVRVVGEACRGIVREGSGFAVGDGDTIVTVAHLMAGMEQPTVELTSGRVVDASLLAVDSVNDLAVLRAAGAGLVPLALSEAVPDATVGVVLAWEAEDEPDPMPFRIDRPVTVRTESVDGAERIERPSWLLAADVETGDSGAALVVDLEGELTAVGVAWGASRRGGGGVAYATRASAVEALLAGVDLDRSIAPPSCN